MAKYRMFYQNRDDPGKQILHVDVRATSRNDALGKGELIVLNERGVKCSDLILLDAIPEVRVPREWWRSYATGRDRISELVYALNWLRRDDDQMYRTPAIILKRANEYAKRDWIYLPSDIRRYLKHEHPNYKINTVK